MSELIDPEAARAVAPEPPPAEPAAPAPRPEFSPVLARLIEEVRNEQREGPHAYNRMHNRHNRSR